MKATREIIRSGVGVEARGEVLAMTESGGSQRSLSFSMRSSHVSCITCFNLLTSLFGTQYLRKSEIYL